ncbi:NCA2 family protein [Aspergillus melleus]|uniref:NCA2 family protein n=1 Tax=Aspergillus melleus TaxID=138277 RepID=UPI001E8E394C|nr:Nuclear control of ATPase protein 2 [Aspergillus melleus]KAH8430364.1 Nuclear control of ATPase protein 2 [Aspergillus melleus]
MSVIHNNICAVDTALDKLKQQVDDLHFNTRNIAEQTGQNSIHASQINSLARTIDSLSVTSKTHPVLQADRIAALLSAIPYAALEPDDPSNPLSAHTADLLWLLAAKAAVQTSGAVLNVLLEQIIKLNGEISYWEDVLSSRFNIGFYTLQTLPVRVWHKTSSAFIASAHEDITSSPAPLRETWMGFYNSVRGCLRQPWQFLPKTMLLSPLLASRSGIYRKRDSLREMKDLNAVGIGILMKECISQHITREYVDDRLSGHFDGLWRDEVSRSVALMASFLEQPQEKNNPQLRKNLISETDESIASRQLHRGAHHACQPPAVVIERLRHIHENLLPKHLTLSARTITNSGRPPRIVRYWLPITVAIFSTSTVFKFLADRHREIIRWVVDIGSTTVQFWNNWVVHPIQRLIRTIRHDENSEIALMSRNSLEADRASLERMVVDFTLDQRESQIGNPDINTNAITEKVREGDLTPVLRAYEKDLRNPFIGTIKGDLVRALLIQIQKTKVDVEIAIGGIDSLLKSQELVFGFVGLTPGIMVSYAFLRWICGIFSPRQGLKVGRKDEFRHAMRNVHRTATSSLTAVGLSAYKDLGLLICDSEVLLQKAKMILKGADLRAFQEDVGDLVDQNRSGKQLDVVARMGWVYSKWLQ